MSDSAPLVAVGETDTPNASRLAQLTRPEFRTFTTPGGRKGVRLEQVFWNALNMLSAGAGQKRSRFVARILEEANEQDINATGAIRSATVASLMEELGRFAPLANPSTMISLLQAGPAPSFALDRRKRLVQANAEFLRYLRSVGGAISGATPVDAAQLSLERPLEALFDELVSGGTTECGISIRFGNRDRRTTARLLLVPPAPASVILGYVLA